MINSRIFYSYMDVTCSIIDKAKGFKIYTSGSYGW